MLESSEEWNTTESTATDNQNPEENPLDDDDLTQLSTYLLSPSISEKPRDDDDLTQLNTYLLSPSISDILDWITAEDIAQDYMSDDEELRQGHHPHASWEGKDSVAME